MTDAPHTRGSSRSTPTHRSTLSKRPMRPTALDMVRTIPQDSSVPAAIAAASDSTLRRQVTSVPGPVRNSRASSSVQCDSRSRPAAAEVDATRPVPAAADSVTPHGAPSICTSWWGIK